MNNQPLLIGRLLVTDRPLRLIIDQQPRRVWLLPKEGELWLAPEDPRQEYRWVSQHEDAILMNWTIRGQPRVGEPA